MSITDAIIKSLIVTEVGDLNGVVAANIDNIWLLYASYAVYPDLRRLYATREALRLLQGQVWQRVTQATDTGVRANLSDKHKALGDRIAEITIEIAVLRKQATGSVGAVSGTLTTTEPITPPSGSQIDADDPRYSGSPYVPIIRG